MKNIINFPPSWCPDAIPSDRGWRHPKTGELLVAVRGGVIPAKKPVKDELLLVEVPRAQEVIPEVVGKNVMDENIKGETTIADEQPQEVITETKSKKKRRGKNV